MGSRKVSQGCCRIAIAVAFLGIAVVPGGTGASAQTAVTRDVVGKVERVEIPPGAQPTPIENFSIQIRSLDTSKIIEAQLDPTGRFTLKNVSPGQYSLEVATSGRIRKFEIGARALNPGRFDLGLSDDGVLTIAVSMKTSSAILDVRGIPLNAGTVDALVFPDDPYIIPGRNAGRSNRVVNGRNNFRDLAPGTYRAFIIDHDLWSGVVYQNVRDQLQDNAAKFEIPEQGEPVVPANYLDRDKVLSAIRACSGRQPGDCPPASFYPTQ